MKTLVIRCEDKALQDRDPLPLIKTAKFGKLLEFARKGAVAKIAPASGKSGSEHLLRGLFGIRPEDPLAQSGLWYAAAAGIKPERDCWVWCCDLLTEVDGIVADPYAGHISSTESLELFRAIDSELGSDFRRWILGEQNRGLLIAGVEALEIKSGRNFCSASALKGKPWKEWIPVGGDGESVAKLMRLASNVIEEHPVNRVRLDLGENPANLVWLWGGAKLDAAGSLGKLPEAVGKPLILANGFLYGGFASAIGADWIDTSGGATEADLATLIEQIENRFAKQDWAYIGLEVKSDDPVERMCVMERIDRLLLGFVGDFLAKKRQMRVTVLIDDPHHRGSLAVSAGSGIEAHPIGEIESLRNGECDLRFEDSVEWFDWITENK